MTETTLSQVCPDVRALPKVFCIMNGTPHHNTAQRFAQLFLAQGAPYRYNWFAFGRQMMICANTLLSNGDDTLANTLLAGGDNAEREWETIRNNISITVSSMNEDVHWINSRNFELTDIAGDWYLVDVHTTQEELEQYIWG